MDKKTLEIAISQNLAHFLPEKLHQFCNVVMDFGKQQHCSIIPSALEKRVNKKPKQTKYYVGTLIVKTKHPFALTIYFSHMYYKQVVRKPQNSHSVIFAAICKYVSGSQWDAPIETQRVRLELGDQIFLKIWNILSLKLSF